MRILTTATVVPVFMFTLLAACGGESVEDRARSLKSAQRQPVSAEPSAVPAVALAPASLVAPATPAPPAEQVPPSSDAGVVPTVTPAP
jgi:hypothetical protein